MLLTATPVTTVASTDGNLAAPCSKINMVFYAYAKNSNDDWSWRYMIIAPNYDILNEWYETVQTKVADNVLVRVTEDFYVFDRSKLALGESTRAGHEAPHFQNKLIFTLMNDLGGRGNPTFLNLAQQ